MNASAACDVYNQKSVQGPRVSTTLRSQLGLGVSFRHFLWFVSSFCSTLKRKRALAAQRSVNIDRALLAVRSFDKAMGRLRADRDIAKRSHHEIMASVSTSASKLQSTAADTFRLRSLHEKSVSQCALEENRVQRAQEACSHALGSSKVRRNAS
jgi:hypothetical protein